MKLDKVVLAPARIESRILRLQEISESSGSSFAGHGYTGKGYLEKYARQLVEG